MSVKASGSTVRFPKYNPEDDRAWFVGLFGTEEGKALANEMVTIAINTPYVLPECISNHKRKESAMSVKASGSTVRFPKYNPEDDRAWFVGLFGTEEGKALANEMVTIAINTPYVLPDSYALFSARLLGICTAKLDRLAQQVGVLRRQTH